jgi:hypothetical protein
MTKRDANRLPSGAKRAVMTEAEYRALIQAHGASATSPACSPSSPAAAG